MEDCGELEERIFFRDWMERTKMLYSIGILGNNAIPANNSLKCKFVRSYLAG